MSNITNGTAYADNTLLGMIRMNDANLAAWEQSDLVQPSQFFRRLPWFPASNGTQHKWTVQTAAAGSAFRTVNNGIANGAGSEKTVTADLKFIDCSWTADVMFARADAKGRDHYLGKRTMKALNAGLTRAEYALIQGVTYDADGPDGLDDLVQAGMKYDATGSGGTRVYMAILGEDDVCGILGNDGVFDVGDVTQQKIITNVETGAGYNADNQSIGGYMCLQSASKYSLAMAYNIDGTSGHSVTDALLRELMKLFPEDRLDALMSRGVIVMSLDGLDQLHTSRTYTSPTGREAEFPLTDWNGIPIALSGAVKNDYAAVTTTTTTTTGE